MSRHMGHVTHTYDPYWNNRNRHICKLVVEYLYLPYIFLILYTVLDISIPDLIYHP